MTFWDFIWFIAISYLFIAYLMVMFSVIGDIFRDEDRGGFAKAIWVLALIFLPVLTVLVYLVVNGSGMAARSNRRVEARARQQADYIQAVAGTTTAPASPVEQIARGKALLDAGAITPPEFDALKANALARL